MAEVMPRTGRGTGGESEAGTTRPLAWTEAVQRFEAGGWFWLGSVRPDGRPHAMPCFAAWSGTTFYVASKATTRKSRNLDENTACVITKDAGDAHLVVEGTARRVTNADGLRRASEAMMRLYSWPTTVAGEELDAEYGAPTSGGPPFRIYEITPVRAFGLPADGELFAPTRFSFD
jgi:nitroimidazol reductase NimA-like FMN-containing flavoprotein (pyridoxamine 5'-phosphate oxidase superfamily)